MRKHEDKLKAMILHFSRIVHEFKKLEMKALDFGTAEKLYPAEIHMLQAIGDQYGETVTELSRKFAVTKGAVSQIVNKLEKKGYLRKERNPAYGKEIILSLSEKGRVAYAGHEAMHCKMDGELLEFIGMLSEEEIKTFETILGRIEKYIHVFL